MSGPDCEKCGEHTVDCRCQQPLILNCNQEHFIRHFINSFHKNITKGNLKDAHHDATAVVLYLSQILGEFPNDN